MGVHVNSNQKHEKMHYTNRQKKEKRKTNPTVLLTDEEKVFDKNKYSFMIKTVNNLGI